MLKIMQALSEIDRKIDGLHFGLFQSYILKQVYNKVNK